VTVIPAKAGTLGDSTNLDPGLRRDDNIDERAPVREPTTVAREDQITVAPAKAWSFAGVSIGMPIAGGTPRACKREPQCRCL
jgi:hypothetical protein